MTITDSNVAQKILKQTSSEVGTLYFFNHIAVVEYNEGVHVDSSNAGQTITALIEYFGRNRPFGLLANRVNSYSISLLDVNDAKQILPNMVAYGVVSHNEAGRMNAEIENSFCKTQNISFCDLYEGLDTIYKRVKEKIVISLN